MYPSAGAMNAAAAAAAVAAARHPGPPQPGQPIKFTVGESCDRIKEEFNFLQAQYHNLKLECEKLASEKIEIQRHYVMYYEMSYGLNVEMHKQARTVRTVRSVRGGACEAPYQIIAVECSHRAGRRQGSRIMGRYLLHLQTYSPPPL
ncbi:Transducin-like enhancer protein 4 [Papilio machaon]|uniref:Transducin-like enhancer protein 4 n=1 Tax=Papilio machaon TaxID=76193 RepID=A0A194REP3_PAPMA|nr:Transducin-like enhancer protein 4 [Papilio machaon]